MTASVLDPSVHEAIRRRFVEHPRSDLDARELLVALVAEEAPLLDAGTAGRCVDHLHAALVGLGPLDSLMRDPAVTDILVNGPGPVWVERDGRLMRSDIVVDDAEIALIVERAFHRNGLSVDRSHPIGDTRLAGGARISAVLPPLAIDGTLVAIRKFSPVRLGLDAFAAPAVATRLSDYVRRRANIVVFGPTGSGKTTLVNSLAGEIDPSQRVVTIEDAAELQLSLPHVVRLEGRPDNGDGAGRVELRTLVRAALRLRPDRLIVGEVRGAEALDMVWAMATGHDGSLSTCHARSAPDVLARLETFVMLAGTDLPLDAVRAQVRSAVDVVIGVRRDGARRKVVSVDEVVADPGHPTGFREVAR
jgi:pilus assembly protein CpaF